jgi:mannose-6-phosphate isomerase
MSFLINQVAFYPLRFEPVYQYRLWGGRRLASLLNAPLPIDELIGEAWLLSDRDDHSSVIANGALKGRTLRQLLDQWPERLLGKRVGRLLDVHGSLSVQVHPSDQQTTYLPAGESGKTEAWVVLEAGPESRVYAGLAPDTTKGILREALEQGAVADHLASFVPKAGDGIFVRAGTVHSLRDLVAFEVQENSDVTFRLYDWGRVDAKTQQRRPLQVEQAMACIDFSQGAIEPVVPMVERAGLALRERLFDCEHFGLWRVRSESPFTVGIAGKPHVLVGIAGEGQIMHDGVGYPCGKGDVLLLPAQIGACSFVPRGSITLLDISLPEAA